MSTSRRSTVATCRYAALASRDGVLCHCAGVAELEVHDAVQRLGAGSVEEVGETTGAGTGCRACHCRIRRVLSGLPATCGGRFDWCSACGCVGALCACPGEAAPPEPARLAS
jgi:bacterioferritin-associated ferredoxin